MKLTPWYPAHIKPVRVGWYQNKYESGEVSKSKWFWDGDEWLYEPDGWVCNEQNRIWRGIEKGE